MTSALKLLRDTFSRAFKVLINNAILILSFGAALALLEIVLLQTIALFRAYAPMMLSAILALLTFPLLILVPIAIERVIVRLLLDRSRGKKSSASELKAEFNLDKAFRFAVVNIITFSPVLIPLVVFQLGGYTGTTLTILIIAGIVGTYLVARLQCSAIAMVDQQQNIDQSLKISWRLTRNDQLACILIAVLIFGIPSMLSSTLAIATSNETLLSLKSLPVIFALNTGYQLWKLVVYVCIIVLYEQLNKKH